MVEMIRACGLDLLVEIAERDDSDWEQAQRMLRLTPAERVRHQTAGTGALVAMREAHRAD